MTPDLSAALDEIRAGIAEDEASADRLAESLELRNRGGTWASSGNSVQGNSVTIITAWTPERVRSEAEVKRRLVAALDRVLALADDWETRAAKLGDDDPRIVALVAQCAQALYECANLTRAAIAAELTPATSPAEGEKAL